MSWPVIHITNIVVRAFAEKYLGINVQMFAYMSALRALEPELMQCEDNVVVLFASIRGCFNHLYSGENCMPKSQLYNGMYGREIDKWKKVCKDIHVWYYATNFSYSLSPLLVLYNLREDMI